MTEELDQQPMLSELEGRILGVLMEKQLTTPDTYPLTLNALVLACNQKTSRVPVMNLDPGEVGHCVMQLRDRKLIEIDYGSRADRYVQRLSRELFLDKQAQAIVNILMLRGPQTLSDLVSKTQRMVEFENAEAVAELMQKMIDKRQPIVRRIAKQAGQREDRFVHLLQGEPDEPAVEGSVVSVTSSKRSELENRVTLLEQQVAVLMELSGVSQQDVEAMLSTTESGQAE